MRAHRSLARLGALVLTASAMLGGAACSLVAGLDKLSFTDEKTCGEACDDADPCTDDDCILDGVCQGTPVPDGPMLTDPIGDCQLVSCVGGEAKAAADDTDVPADDGDSCTEELCAAGQPSHPLQPDGSACVASTGLAGTCAAGACQVKCDADATCDDKNPCTTEACDLMTLLCASTPLDGVDAPGSVNECFASTCVNGKATPPKSKLPGAPCSFGGGKVCDGVDHCVACNVAADCAPTAKDECSVAVCNANKTCGTAPAPAGTKLVNAPQKPGDCVTLYCDGIGGVTDVDDDADMPDDNNVCTTQGCMSGAITTTPVALNTDCGAGMACNGKGVCKTATAQLCMASADCASGVCSDGVCCSTGCVTACKSCNVTGLAGTCSNIPAMQHDSSPAGACAGVNFCDGKGTCKLGAGQPCTLPADCISLMCPAGVCQ
jgi:hypothetical protein